MQGGLIGKYVADECVKLMGGCVSFCCSNDWLLILIKIDSD